MNGSEIRVSRARVEHLSEDEYFWALMEPAWGEQSQGTYGQRVLASTTYFIRDVGNGGLEQALWNFDSAEIDFVIESLSQLGAHQHASVVRAGLLKLLGDAPPYDTGAASGAY